mgnify:CR=1 FL=1
MIEQRGQQVTQETEKLKAEIRADQETEVATIAAETVREMAKIGRDTAGLRANTTFKLGKAKADVTRMVEGEKAAGYGLKIGAIGDSEAYNLFQFSAALRPETKINIIHAGPGTLWTDLQKASLGDLGGAILVQPKPVIR